MSILKNLPPHLARKGTSNHYQFKLPRGVSIVTLPVVTLVLPGADTDTQAQFTIRLNSETRAIERIWLGSHADRPFYPTKEELGNVILAAINGLPVMKQIGELSLLLLPEHHYRAEWIAPDTGQLTPLHVKAVSLLEAATIATNWIVGAYEKDSSKCGEARIVRTDLMGKPEGTWSTLATTIGPTMRESRIFTLTYEDLNGMEKIVTIVGDEAAAITAATVALEYHRAHSGAKVDPGFANPILRDEHGAVVALVFALETDETEKVPTPLS